MNRRFFFRALAGMPLVTPVAAAKNPETEAPKLVIHAPVYECAGCGHVLDKRKVGLEGPLVVRCLTKKCRMYGKTLMVPAIAIPTDAAHPEYVAELERTEREMSLYYSEQRRREDEQMEHKSLAIHAALLRQAANNQGPPR
jgi:hypothetical protein